MSDAIEIAVDKPDGEVSLGIRPEHVHVLTEPQDGAIQRVFT